MGAGNSKDNLYNAINADNPTLATQILKEAPTIINEPVSEENKTTPLGRAAWRGNVEMLYTLIELGADVNFVGPQEISPLQWASQRGKDEAVDFLVQKGAKLDYVSKDNMNALDYAILYGSYNTAWKLINLGLKPREVDWYVAMAKEKHVLFHDYEKMIDHLNRKVPLEETERFDEAPPEPTLKDPVIDPRETWTEFAKRIIEFEEPPLVERDSLPAELRPENRALGRLRSYFNGLSPYPEEDVARPDVAEEHVKDSGHVEVDILKEKAKENGENENENENNDEGLVKAKPEAEEKPEVTDRNVNVMNTEDAESDSPSRKGSDLPNQSCDVLIKPIKAAQVQVAGGHKEQDDKENNIVEA